MIVGKCTPEVFNDTAYSWWWQSGYEMYQPNALTLDSLRDVFGIQNITIVMGTWCSDSRMQVPRFYKMLDALGCNAEQINLVCVDRKKMGLKNETENLDIKLVPTFIIYRGEKEIGRIIESPVVSLESDLLKILLADLLRYESEKRPERCPACGSKKIAEILYGKIAMTPEIEQQVQRGEVYLGGCIITGDDPRWKCLICKANIYRTKDCCPEPNN
jgi:hypothetical protein